MDEIPALLLKLPEQVTFPIGTLISSLLFGNKNNKFIGET